MNFEVELVGLLIHGEGHSIVVNLFAVVDGREDAEALGHVLLLVHPGPVLQDLLLVVHDRGCEGRVQFLLRLFDFVATFGNDLKKDTLSLFFSPY